MSDDRSPGEGLDRAALAELLQAVASRADRQAFALLFGHFGPRIKAYLMRLGADDGTAEELVQETMVTVWRRATTYDAHQASAATWIFTIARNKRIDGLRRERRPEFDPTDPAFVPDPPPPADEVIDTAQRENRVRAAIRDLPDEQAVLLREAFYEGKSHRRIAEERDMPLGTVKSRLRLAFGRLRKALDGEM